VHVLCNVAGAQVWTLFIDQKAKPGGPFRPKGTWRDRWQRRWPKMNFVELLGQPMAAQDFDRQVPDLKVSVAVLNGVTALGIPVMEAVG
jgi:hypothetical protein